MGYDPRENLDLLEIELEKCHVVAMENMPEDVVTMNSRVHLKNLDTEEDLTCTLVFPEQADLEHNHISIFAPLGMAILGRRIGETFEWVVPNGARHYRITEIFYQPEKDNPV